MAINKVRLEATQFARKYCFYNPSLDALKDILFKQGYTIVEYNNIYNDESVELLLETLKLDDYARNSKGFTYADNNIRLVFLHEDLSDDEKLIVLAHEEGHIFCEHLSTTPIIGKDVRDEYEANEFSHYILKRHTSSKIKAWLRKRWKLIGLIAVLSLLVVTGMFIWYARNQESHYLGNYYITATGKKYHRENCIFVKGKATARRMTLEEYDSGEFEPCAICLPDKN